MAAAAAYGAMLQLVMGEGPRQGETLEFSAASKAIRIGRVVKGNTVAIKDPGISQKHLRIDPLPAGGWTLTDLDTCNGTRVNGSPAPPSAPITLADGDCIKVGEATSIFVRIITPDAEAVAGQMPEAEVPEKKVAAGRGRRAGTRANPSAIEISETKAPSLERIGRGRGRGRGRGKGKGRGGEAVEVQNPEMMEKVEEEEGEKVVGRRGGRGRGISQKGVVNTRSTRSTRSLKVQEDLSQSSVENLEESMEENVEEAMGTKAVPSSVPDTVQENNEISGIEAPKRIGGRGRLRTGGVTARSTRSTKVQEVILLSPMENLVESMEVDVGDGVGEATGTRADRSGDPDTVQANDKILEIKGSKRIGGRGRSRTGRVSTRSTRSTKMQDDTLLSPVENLVDSVEDVGGDVGKAMEKRADPSSISDTVQENDEILEIEDPKGIIGRKSSRTGQVRTHSTRSTKVQEDMLQSPMENLVERIESDAVGEAMGRRADPSGVLDTVQEIDEIIEIKAPKKIAGRGRSRTGGVRTRSTRAVTVQEDILQSMMEVQKSGVERVEEEEEKEKVEESMEHDAVGAEQAVGNDDSDWEKMTLGEWFDRMEVYLPQVIREEADYVIARLREKAEKLKEAVRKDLLIAK